MSRRKDIVTWANMHPESRTKLAAAMRRGIQKAKEGQTVADDENTEQQGVIEDVIASGGLMTLVVKKADGKLERVRGDSGPTGRALIGIFGRDILAGAMTLDVDKLKGREIAWDTDDLGILAYIRDPNED